MNTIIMLTRRPLALLGLTLLLNGTASADTLTLLPPQTGDLVPAHLSDTLPVRPIANNRRDTVRFSHPLSAEQSLTAQPVPHRAASKRYWFEAGGSELAKGVALDISAAQAVVRISPLDSLGTALNPERMTLSQGNNALRGQAAMEAIAGASQMAASGTPFPAGTTAFRLADKVGAGRFMLKSDEAVPADARYLVEVVERQSTSVMTLQADADTYLSGGRLQAKLALETKGQGAITMADGYLLSPSGRRYPLTLSESADGSYAINQTLPKASDNEAGLWELHTELQGKVAGGPLRRNAKTAFALTVPHAALRDNVEVSRDTAGNLIASLSAEVTAASRYVVRGTLYGSDTSRHLKPLAIAETARWLDAGKGELVLAFNGDDLAASGLTAPYELRQLQLADQGRMSIQQRRQRALVIE